MSWDGNFYCFSYTRIKNVDPSLVLNGARKVYTGLNRYLKVDTCFILNGVEKVDTGLVFARV